MCRRREKGGGRWFHGGACPRVILKGTEHTRARARALLFLFSFFCIKQKKYIYVFDSDALQSVILESSGLVDPLRYIFFTRGPKCQNA